MRPLNPVILHFSQPDARQILNFLVPKLADVLYAGGKFCISFKIIFFS